MSTLNQIHNRHIGLMQTSMQIITHLLRDVSQELATTNRDRNDGDKGWTTLEVLCHLRDFDGYFRGRAEMMVAQENPQLPAYDHEAIAISNAYNSQSLSVVLAELQASRNLTVAFFSGLTDDQRQRTGRHPERDHFNMTDAVMQVGLHDVGHIEQMTRIIQRI